MFTESLDENMEVVEEVEDTGSILESELNDKAVYEAIKKLPNGCRVIFTLYQLEGYDHQEIADILGVSVSTSKSQYHRAKILLKEQLLEHVMPSTEMNLVRSSGTKSRHNCPRKHRSRKKSQEMLLR